LLYGPFLNSHPAQVLTSAAHSLLFMIAATVLSLLSLIALWWFSDLPSDENDVTIVEGNVDGDERATHCLHLTALFLGTATRLLLGGLGTMAMVWGSISQDRSRSMCPSIFSSGHAATPSPFCRLLVFFYPPATPTELSQIIPGRDRSFPPTATEPFHPMLTTSRN